MLKHINIQVTYISKQITNDIKTLVDAYCFSTDNYHRFVQAQHDENVLLYSSLFGHAVSVYYLYPSWADERQVSSGEKSPGRIPRYTEVALTPG